MLVGWISFLLLFAGACNKSDAICNFTPLEIEPTQVQRGDSVTISTGGRSLDPCRTVDPGGEGESKIVSEGRVAVDLLPSHKYDPQLPIPSDALIPWFDIELAGDTFSATKAIDAPPGDYFVVLRGRDAVDGPISVLSSKSFGPN